ncbi:hypothetical protein TNCT_191061 [Trichonephila clavata]|uniref:Uncharacterized protein n=1 Tax=Trichonephila clavata TaxID=2740835 RepID=A0A8X6L6B7_TRICU|nr:hypothetical protein TNCT_191061 [Trichonephila clavata]
MLCGPSYLDATCYVNCNPRFIETGGEELRRQCQAGSLSGAEHLSKGNAGVPRPARPGRKPGLEQRGKSRLDLVLQ